MKKKDVENGIERYNEDKKLIVYSIKAINRKFSEQNI